MSLSSPEINNPAFSQSMHDLNLVIISTSFFDPQNYFLIFSLPLPLTKPIFSKNSD